MTGLGGVYGRPGHFEGGDLGNEDDVGVVGDAAWWAATTVTTIGYGDVVPGTSGGRFIAVFVMFASVASVSMSTAVITASFVGYQQRRLGHDADRHQELIEMLGRIEQRLDTIEQKPG